eukprot:NODE_4076_length_699_cov_91.201538_g3450_i0.p4 GENE.NODE_4076_length_699_cov_91.201538_g3450_i0~~NODE_4076_length_699_cov_91.201538_g3450_i0.p4  ORF type:complete len:90 (-),score=11.58 NODE_4076_length_699_cov_91.201538_g3450_i0:428-658(-)
MSYYLHHINHIENDSQLHYSKLIGKRLKYSSSYISQVDGTLAQQAFNKIILYIPTTVPTTALRSRRITAAFKHQVN